MPIALTCTGCGKRYELPDAAAGKKARCKQCGEEMRVPEARAASPKVSRPPLADLLDDEPAPLMKSVARPGAVPDDDELPPPPRAGYRPAKVKRTASTAGLPLLIKAGLILIAVLVVGPGLVLVGVAVVTGKTGLAGPALAILGFFVCAAVCSVCYLKMLFLAASEGGFTAFSFLRNPFFALGFVMRRWNDVGPLFLGHLAGLAGLLLWFVFVPPYLKPGMRQNGPDTQPDAGQSVEVVVADIPSEDVGKAIGEKLKTLVDQASWSSWSSQSASGQPTRYKIAPVNDPRAFADRITFGTVSNISGRTITLTSVSIPAEEVAAVKAGKPIPSTPASTTTGFDTGVEESPFKHVAKDESPFQPVHAAESDPLSKLIAGLKSSDDNERNAAVAKLTRMKPVDERREEVQGALAPLLDKKDEFFVDDVIRAMVAWHTPETVTTLTARVTDGRDGVRRRAITALGELGDASAAEAIVGRLKEDSMQAEDALRKLGPDAEKAVIPLLRSPDQEIRTRACNILKVIGGEDTLAIMRKAKPDPDLGVRMAAQDAMQTIFARVRGAQ